MNLLFCFDNKYEQHFVVALTSVLLNNRIPIKVYLITNQISSKLKQILDKLSKLYTIDIYTSFIDAKHIVDLKVSHHASLANYFRLFVEDLLHNKIIDGNCLLLDKKWNSLVDLYEGRSEVNDQSIIIHFVGSLKPWHSWCINLKNTSICLISDNHCTLMLIQNILYHLSKLLQLLKATKKLF